MSREHRHTQGIQRRDFVGSLAGLMAAGTLTQVGAGRPAAQERASDKKTIGIQVGSVSFVDEGVEPVLDIFQKRAGINALWMAGCTFGRGLGGRQIPGRRLPDHGKLEYDVNYHGGNFATVHPQYYTDTGVDPKALRAPDHGNWDFFTEVIPAAQKRGMKSITWIEDVWRDDIPNIEKLQCVDLHGRKTGRMCHNNPLYQNLLQGIITDYLNSYALDGIMYGSERQGAFANALGMRHGGADEDPGRVECFCQYCEAKAKKVGIDFARVKAAFLELEKFVNAARAQRRPVDGYYVTLWRHMLSHPELIAWEHFFHEGLRDAYRMMHDQVKSIKPNVWFGLHIWHNNSFNPIYRAEQDLSQLTQYADFLKMVMYHNAGGPRIASYIDSVSETTWGDVSRDELLEFHYRILNYEEAPYAKVRQTGLKNDYVFREATRAMEGKGKAHTLILPAIDIGVHNTPGDAETTREDVKEAVIQALQAGVDGVLLSRKYSEMRLDWLSGAGDALGEVGLA
ncbi:MAG: hypothetical protein ACRD2X_15490 [Vicinamibacteraceae bacterium]